MLSRLNAKHLIAAGVVLWLVLVIAGIPASWGAWAVNKAGAVQLSQVSGSLWSGQAASAVVNVEGKSLPLGILRWDLSPWSLLILRPCVNLNAKLERQKLSGESCFGFGSVSVKNAEFNGPAALADPWLPGFSITGDLSLQVQQASVSMAGAVNSLDGSLSWSKARLHNGIEWLTLGAYGARLQEDGEGGVKAEVSDLEEGPLQLKVNVRAQPEKGIALKGNVTVRENASPVFEQALSVVANKTGNRSYTLDMSL